MTKSKVCVVGAGITGATIARYLAEQGHDITVFDARDHVAGNCHTVWDDEASCYHHVYGPHIFHSDDKEVIDWVSRFTTIEPYRHSVKATHKERVFTLPITLHTLNQFFSRSMSPAEAENHLTNLVTKITDRDENFETRALSMVGKDLYDAFFKDYTRKQWGTEPTEIPASVLKRLPVRFNYDDNYFHHSFQGLPANGYTSMVEKMLDHPSICVTLSTRVEFSAIQSAYSQIFWSGPIEEVFAADMGYLPYRTLDFETSKVPDDFQGCAVMNYPDPEVGYTRITQHNYFRPSAMSMQPIETSLVSYEFSRAWAKGDIQYYPVNLVGKNEKLLQYQQRAAKIKNLHLCGRLGLFRYMDMDVAVSAALALSKTAMK